jgi:iron complex outermembrane receptor protein
MNTLLPRILLSVSFCAATLADGFGQLDSTKGSNYDNLSLKDLLSVKIVSVSKKVEFLFNAPLAASVVTKEEIRRTGCTSIMEALRLVPGMIVREQSNGNYDIYLRGMDNVPPNAP